MPQRQKALLRTTLEEYVQAYRGDGRGHSTQHFKDEPISEAKALLERLGGSQDVRAEQTPGQRAAHSEGRGFENASRAARELIEE